MATTLNINGAPAIVEVEPALPLLWVLRDLLGLTGTKFGCGVGVCGACTVHVAGQAMRSCTLPIAAVGTHAITTIEGLGQTELDAVQRAWIEQQVPQCGYCQSGMIIVVTALLRSSPHPSDADIDQAVTNICRCGTYQRIRRAVHAAADALEK